MAVKQQEKSMVFTSLLVDESIKRIDDGISIKRFENPWVKNEIGIRRSGISFRMTADEQQEYVKCALDIKYFAEKHCKTKTDDGSIDNITLRDYQEEILDSFSKNRFNILMSSRQSGKCNLLTTKALCEIIDENGIISTIELPFYKLLFIYKIDKSIYDYIKYSIYSIINKIQNTYPIC